MASTSSKALPYLSIAIALILAVVSAAGYGAQIDQAIGLLSFILPVTASGGLINKSLEVVREKRKAFETEELKAIVKQVLGEVKQ